MPFMNYDAVTGISRCDTCGHRARGDIMYCPQCQQIELQKEQNNLLKQSMKGGSSGGDGGTYLLIATVGLGLVFAVVYYVIQFVGWVLGGIALAAIAVWNFVTAPFRYAYHFFMTDSAWWKYILLAILVIWVISLLGKKDSTE